MEEVNVRPIDVDRLTSILPADRAERLLAAAERARAAFGDRVVWHVNATAHGGGVAEILRSEIPLLRDLGLLADWKLITGDQTFFSVTKAIHNGLQGAARGLPALLAQPHSVPVPPGIAVAIRSPAVTVVPVGSIRPIVSAT